METVAVKGEVRSELGKKATKAVRNDGKIPCVIYGGETNIHFSTLSTELRDIIYTPEFKLAEIELDGKKYKCILQDITFHPVTDEVLHVDFLELVEGNNIKVQVPVRFDGVAEGVKTGGKLQRNVRRVRIKTTPEHLVNEVRADVSALEMGQSVRVRDIEPAEGVEIKSAPGIPLATVVVPRALRSATTAAEKEAAEGEGEGAEGETEGEESEETKEES